MRARKSIFIILNGGIGTGPFAKGVPAIQDMIDGLKGKFDLHIFSLHPVSKKFEAEGYTLIAPRFKLPFIPKLIWLFFSVCFNHVKHKPALIHSLWGYPSGLAGAIFKSVFNTPLIIHLQGGDSVGIKKINYGEFCSPIKSKVLRWAYNRADVLITLSEFHKQALYKSGITKTSTVISFGVDLRTFTPINKKRNEPVKLLHVASLNKVKSQETILNAFLLILKKYDARLTIIGEDTLNGNMQSRSRALKLENKVVFTGCMKREDIVPFLQQSDVLLHSSLFESQALVINEALACGIPVCGTKVGLVSDLASVCVNATPIEDHEALAQSVVEVLSDEQRNNAMINAGLEWSKKNDVHQTTEKITQLYNQLVL